MNEYYEVCLSLNIGVITSRSSLYYSYERESVVKLGETWGVEENEKEESVNDIATARCRHVFSIDSSFLPPSFRVNFTRSNNWFEFLETIGCFRWIGISIILESWYRKGNSIVLLFLFYFLFYYFYCSENPSCNNPSWYRDQWIVILSRT